jgi:hypothetical protein
MPQPAISIIGRALQASKAGSVSSGTPVGYTTQALQFLNAILSDLCEEYDFALARGVVNLSLNTTQTTLGNGAAIISGPNIMPLDYLRTSGSSGSTGAENSAIYYINGVPYPLIPCDLAEFDQQVMQAGIQSYPWLMATDMSVQNIMGTFQGDTVANATTLLNIANAGSLTPGQSLAGNGLTPGTTLLALVGTTGTLSLPATQTASQASILYGAPPVAYVYPPPSGSFPTRVRYQRQMPDLTQAQVNAGAYAWFPNDGFLVKELSARLMMLSDDAREGTFSKDAMMILAAYNAQKDDDANRAKTVQLDRRTFGNAFSRLPNTKIIGW